MVKKVVILILLVCVTLFSVSCSKAYNLNDGKSESLEKEKETEQVDDKINGNVTDRKIIITAEYEIETKDLKSAVNSFTKQISDLGGYIESSSVTQDVAEFTFRVPSDKLDTFFNFTEESGNITYSSQKGKDVTIEYHDTQSELKALKIQEERLLALLENATTLDNILTLEKELTEVRKSIEKINTRLNEFDNLIDYATVDITLNRVKDFTKPDTSFTGLVSKSFKSSINFGKNLIKYLAVVIVWLLPYLLVAAVIVFTVMFISKRKRDKFNKKVN